MTGYLKLPVYIAVLILVSACQRKIVNESPTGAQPDAPVPANRTLVTSPTAMELSIDPLTGCHYLSRDHRSGLIPRMDSMGEHICREADRRK